MKLITRIMESNEAFATKFARRGHSQYFEREHGETSPPGAEEDCADSADESPLPSENEGACESEDENKSSAEKSESGSSPFPELNDILLNYDYVCTKPQNNIMDCVKEIYRSSRGPELGTVSISQNLP